MGNQGAGLSCLANLQKTNCQFESTLERKQSKQWSRIYPYKEGKQEIKVINYWSLLNVDWNLDHTFVFIEYQMSL